MAAKQEIRACRGCVQAFHNVSTPTGPFIVLALPFPVCNTYMQPTWPSNPDVWAEVTFPSDVVKTELQSYISKRLTPQPTKVRADVEVTCFGYEGIDAVKNALRAGEAQNTVHNKSTNNPDAIPAPNEATVKVKLVSPPLYVLTSQCLEKSTGIACLERAIKEIEGNIRANGGGCVTKMAPKAVTENDDAELQALMEKREKENAEVSGDESVSESDEGVVAETI